VSDPIHTIVTGPSSCGKTSLVRAIVGAAQRQRVGVIALDPELNNWWRTAYLTDAPARFLAWARAAQRCVLVVEEAKETLARDPQYSWLTTRSRKWGHHCIVIAQRYTMVLPDLRASCDEIYTFRQGARDVDAIVDHFTDETLRAASDLQQYEFLHKRPFEPVKRRKLAL
jgi:hypothetical protein